MGKLILQFRIPIYSLTGISGCEQYLAASKARKISETFKYAFPDIHKVCLVCLCANCAIWKGYYSRMFTCEKLNFFGPVWIRKGLCTTRQVHFSMLPDFCITYVCWSIFMFLQLFILKGKSFFYAFDSDVAYSSLYWKGALLVQLLRINASLYLQHPPKSNSISELKSFSFELMEKLLLLPEFNWNRRIISSAVYQPS